MNDTLRILGELAGIRGQLHHLHQQMRELKMAITPQIQVVLDAIQQNSDLVTAVDQALKQEALQITDLQTQVKALQDQLAQGGTLSAEDLAGLASGLTQLQDTNTKLQNDVPANTPAAPATGG